MAVNLERVEPIINAVLYEGYILYPYRPNTAKNRQRWSFGGLYPQAWHDATGGADACRLQAQCLVEASPDTMLEIRLRFLHPVAREIGRLSAPEAGWPARGEPDFEIVSCLTVDGRPYRPWQEAVERDVVVAETTLGALHANARRVAFAFDAARALEPITDGHGQLAGVLQRRQAAVSGRAELRAETLADGVWRLTVHAVNTTAMPPTTGADREAASLLSFASTHLILGVTYGDFISLMDPPQALADVAAACDNQGVFPVLVGDAGHRDMLLASPIILYDHPEVAPQSRGDFYDATEIDELLSLSILALTDGEKREMSAADPRAAALLERTEALTGDDILAMHGVLRDPQSAAPAGRGQPPDHGPRLAYADSDDGRLKVGERVRLRPKPGGDIWDTILAGRTAVIEAIERDFENRVHVAVAIDDDPGREWGFARMPGHRFFFSPEEVEAVAADDEAAP